MVGMKKRVKAMGGGAMKKRMKKGGLSGGQTKLDKNSDGKISGADFAMMKKGGSVKKRVKKKKKVTKKRVKAMGGGSMKKRMNMGGSAMKKRMKRGGAAK